MSRKKITDEIKKMVYKDYMKTGCQLSKLAHRYSLSENTISSIITEKLKNRKYLSKSKK